MTLPSPTKVSTQSPPQDERVWELSWARGDGLFRFRCEEGEWLCTTLVGKGLMESCDSIRGRLYIRGHLLLQEDRAFFYPPSAFEIPTPVGPTKDLPLSHYRLCFNRAGNNWRLRNERTGELTFVKEYRGVLNLDWLDRDPHVFHTGLVVLTETGEAYLVDPETSK